MSATTTNAPVQGDVDERDRRAATGAMVAVQEGPGLYRVYSGTKANYLVDVLDGSCECPAATYQNGMCKHARRVEMSLGERPIPNGVRIDPTLAARRGR